MIQLLPGGLLRIRASFPEVRPPLTTIKDARRSGFVSWPRSLKGVSNDEEPYPEILKAVSWHSDASRNAGAVSRSLRRVAVISTATNTVVGTVPVGSAPFGVAITPNGAFVYVTNTPVGTVSVITTSTNAVVATVPVGFSPVRLAIDPTRTSVYVPNTASLSVSVISTATNTVGTTISLGTNPFAVAFPVTTKGPTNKDQCKNGGWQTFTNPSFKNQGQCIKFVNHMAEVEH